MNALIAMLLVVFVGVLGLGLMAAPAAYAEATTRLEGRYEVDVKRKGFGTGTWKFRPRCGGLGPCATSLRIKGGPSITLRYRRAYREYTGWSRVLRGPCKLVDRATGDSRTIPKAFQGRMRIRIYRFRGVDFDAAETARGKLELEVEPTSRGERAGCFDYRRQKISFRLTRIGH